MKIREMATPAILLDMDALERRYLRRELTAQELMDALTK